MGNKRKAHYKQSGPNSKKHKDTQLQFGQYGFMCTFVRGRDRQAKSELFELLKSYVPEIDQSACSLPNDTATKEDSSDNIESSDEEIDVAGALKREIKQLKESRLTEDFKSVDPGVNNTLFFTTKLPKHSHMLYRILEDAKNGCVRAKGKCLLRILPVLSTCRAEEEKMATTLTETIKSFSDSTDLPQPTTYKVETKIRNNTDSGLSSTKLIQLVGNVVNKTQPLWRVDLTNPTLHIFIDVLKTVCCISVVKDYVKYRKFNLQELSVAWNNAQSASGGSDARVQEKDASGSNQKVQTDPADKETVAVTAEGENKEESSVQDTAEQG